LYCGLVDVHYFYANTWRNLKKGNAMKIYAVIKQYRDETPEIVAAWQTQEDAQKHVDDVFDACQGQPLYKYYVQESFVIKQ
jgi:hypothetical protein